MTSRIPRFRASIFRRPLVDIGVLAVHGMRVGLKDGGHCGMR
jgi:hypothetical protein